MFGSVSGPGRKSKKTTLLSKCQRRHTILLSAPANHTIDVRHRMGLGHPSRLFSGALLGKVRAHRIKSSSCFCETFHFPPYRILILSLSRSKHGGLWLTACRLSSASSSTTITHHKRVCYTKQDLHHHWHLITKDCRGRSCISLGNSTLKKHTRPEVCW